MKITIIDPGLLNREGHNFATDFSLAKIFKAHGYNVEILCHKNIKPEIKKYFLDNNIEILNIFDINAYSSIPYKNLNNFLKCLEINKNNLTDYNKSGSHSDVAIWTPCVFPLQLITNLYVKISKKQFIFLEPSYFSFTDNSIKIYNLYYEKFIERNDIIYLSVQEKIKKMFLRFLPIKIERCPFLSFSNFINNKKNKIEKIGIFGFEKIIEEPFIECFIKLLKNFKIHFDFHDPKNNFKSSEWSTFENKNLEQILNFEKFSFSSFRNDLNKKISEYDSIIYFFNPIYYQLIPSGIVSESIATGRPVILPKGNNPAYIIEKYNCGLMFEWDNPKSLKKNIQFCIDNFRTLKQNSFNASKIWNKKEGIQNFLKFIQSKI